MAHKVVQVSYLAFFLPTVVPSTPPTDVAVDAVSPYQVRVTWSPPMTPNGIITQYSLSATLNGSPLSTITVPGDALSRDIDELTPFGIITVTISASTFVGEGPFSPIAMIRTLEARKYTYVRRFWLFGVQ